MAASGVSRRAALVSRLSAAAEALHETRGGGTKQQQDAAAEAFHETRGGGRNQQLDTAAAAARWVEYDEEEASGTPRCDVFINHRGADTKRTVARLLYDRLALLQLQQHRTGSVGGGGIRAFLDNMSMRPGDRLDDRIGAAIRDCSVAVAIFSPNYCDSEYCLRELAMIVESHKTIIPIFYDIKPSDLILPHAVVDSNVHLPRDVERIKFALREAKNTVGLTYDTATGDMAELVAEAADAVLYHIAKLQRVQRRERIVSRL